MRNHKICIQNQQLTQNQLKNYKTLEFLTKPNINNIQDNLTYIFVSLPKILLSSNFSMPEENNLFFNQRSLYISDGHNGELITP